MAQLGLSVDDVPLVAGYSWRLGTCAAADAAGAGALPSSSGAHGGHGGGGGSAVAAAAAEAAAALAEGRGAVVSGGIVRLEAAAQRLGRQREQAQEQQERAQQQAQQAQGQQAQQQQERQTQGQGQAQQAQAQEEEQQQARRRSGPSSSTAPSLGGARLAPGKGPCTTTLFLADWACPHISMHARALSHGTLLGLLSEHELATVMGVEDLDVVMDGIAWR
ncbi:hypothetical protein FOA52_015752 [Chlamydomonas sp. UWO 241]|nr:hypothetical protein FOA52_015752 [Chlamydomonas sp. UWO 241]